MDIQVHPQDLLFIDATTQSDAAIDGEPLFVDVTVPTAAAPIIDVVEATGPPGPPGATGSAGPGGPVGATGPAGSDGTEILDGSGVPADSVGVVGDYYVDAGHALYGPKGTTVSYGPGQSAIPPAATPNPGFSHPTIEYGAYVKFIADGEVTGVRYWRDAGTTQVSRKVNVWNSTTHARLATATIANDGGGSGWKTVTLTPPLLVAFNDVIVVTVGNTNAYSRTDSAAYPISNGGLVSLTQGTYDLALDAFPGTVASINFFVDVVFRPVTGGVWPVAVPGFPEAPDDGTLYGRKSLAWAPVTSGAATFVGDGPPASPIAGQLWFESDTGQLLIWYTDANSSQWVPATVGAQGPPGIWTEITQAAYDALSPPNPATLYVVIG